MSAAVSKKYIIPPLRRLTEDEADAIQSMFRLYDYTATGLIQRHLAVRLLKTLGFASSGSTMSPEVSLREFLLYVDQRSMERDNLLSFSMQSFKTFVSTPSAEYGPNVITQEGVAKFYESVGRPAPSQVLTKFLFTTMLDYDDCARNPEVKADSFERDVTYYAKKSNVMKQFR